LTTDIPTHYDGSILVTNPLMCPNISCNITFPHTYMLPTRPPPPPPHVIPVEISRFAVPNNPFPTLNCWEVASKPPVPLRHGGQVHLRIYGTLVLISVASCRRAGKEWEVFSGINTSNGLRRVFVVVPREWVQKPERKKISGIVSFYYRLISFFYCG
jgi:hypothetical protein